MLFFVPLNRTYIIENNWFNGNTFYVIDGFILFDGFVHFICRTFNDTVKLLADQMKCLELQ